LTFGVICAANLASFMLPHLVFVIESPHSSFSESWAMYSHHWPSYIIGIGFLIMTLFIEVPIIYISLKSFAQNKKQLITVIIVVNIITTAAVAVTERIAYKGQW